MDFFLEIPNGECGLGEHFCDQVRCQNLEPGQGNEQGECTLLIICLRNKTLCWGLCGLAQGSPEDKPTKPEAKTKYIKTCTELSHPGCLLLQFYALNYVLIISYLFVSLTYMCICLKVNSYKSESIQRGNLQDPLDWIKVFCSYSNMVPLSDKPKNMFHL